MWPQLTTSTVYVLLSLPSSCLFYLILIHFPAQPLNRHLTLFPPLSLPHAEGDPNRGVCWSMPARPHYMPHSWTHLRNPCRDIGAGASSSDSYAAVETNGVMGSGVTSVSAGTVESQDTLLCCRLHTCIFFSTFWCILCTIVCVSLSDDSARVVMFTLCWPALHVFLTKINVHLWWKAVSHFRDTQHLSKRFPTSYFFMVPVGGSPPFVKTLWLVCGSKLWHVRMCCAPIHLALNSRRIKRR